jgi:S2P endopeptidase
MLTLLLLLLCSFQVELRGFGVFLWFLYPGAFAEFVSAFTHLPPAKQLSIYCAGALHNALTFVLSYLLLSSMPILLSPFYYQPSGAGVISVSQVFANSICCCLAEIISVENSPLDGILLPSDVIVKLNGHTVTDRASWYAALEQLLLEPDGRCLTNDQLKQIGET